MAAAIKISGLTGYTVAPPPLPAKVRVADVLALGGEAPPPPAAPATVQIVDVLAISEGIAAPPPPPPSPAAKVIVAAVVASTQSVGAARLFVDAGPDQSGVEPGVSVTLKGSVAGGTATSYDWSQAAGTPVTLSGSGVTRTFVAPATTSDDSMLFAFTATDSGGTTSTPDTVTVTVLAATECIRSGGAWVPRASCRRTGSSWT